MTMTTENTGVADPNAQGANAQGANAQGGGADWIADLDGDAKALVAQKGYKTPNDLAKAYGSLQSMLGADKIALPGKDTPLEQWDGWTKLGAPESADKYELTKPAEGDGYDEAFAGRFREMAHKMRMPAHLAKAVHDFAVGEAAAARRALSEAAQQTYEQAEATLHTKWGNDFDTMLGYADAAAKKVPGLLDELKTLRLQNAPALAQLLAEYGRWKWPNEHGLIAGAAGGGIMTVEAAKAEEARLQADAAFTTAFLDRRHPGHVDAAARMARLQQLIHGAAA